MKTLVADIGGTNSRLAVAITSKRDREIILENIQKFNVDFPDADIVRLEQNYRSTSTILTAANKLISNNHGRLGKNLWTDGSEGEQISLYEAFNEQDEARFIVDRLQDLSLIHI